MDSSKGSCQRLQCKETHDHEGHARTVKHEDHEDFVINGRLHHVHKDHCDDHGPAQ